MIKRYGGTSVFTRDAKIRPNLTECVVQLMETRSDIDRRQQIMSKETMRWITIMKTVGIRSREVI